MDKKDKKGIVSLILVIGAILATLLIVLIINTNNVSSKAKGGMSMAGAPSGAPSENPSGGAPNGEAKGNQKGKSSSFGANATSVSTVIAKAETMKDYVNTNGDVETQSSIEVYPSIAGKVVQVNVSLGSHVSKGDEIAYIDPSAAGVSYKWSPVVAPISGSILQTPVKTGQQVSSNTVVTKIGDIENLQISISVPERYVGDLKIGLKAEVTLEAYPGVIFDATVVSVSPVLDSSSRTKTVILNFDRKDSRIDAGMYAKVKLYTVEYPNSIAIQQDAIVTVNNDKYLYVVKDDDTVEKREVTLGKNINGYYQITSGVNVGDRVVVAGMLTLSDGSKVKDITNGNKTKNKE